MRLYTLIKESDAEKVDEFISTLTEFANSIILARKRRSLKTWRGITKADEQLEARFVSLIKNYGVK